MPQPPNPKPEILNLFMAPGRQQCQCSLPTAAATAGIGGTVDAHGIGAHWSGQTMPVREGTFVFLYGLQKRVCRFFIWLTAFMKGVYSLQAQGLVGRRSGA